MILKLSEGIFCSMLVQVEIIAQVESNLVKFLDQNGGVFGSYMIDIRSVSFNGE